MITEFAEFVSERHNIYLRRAAGHAQPWTDDPILRSYSFCNMYRELDKTTQWIAKNWRTPNQSDPDLWFAMTIARNVNLPDTLEELGYPVPWNPDLFLAIMKGRVAGGERVYGPAYMIRAGRTEGQVKATYQIEHQFNPAWEKREELRPKLGMSLADYHRILLNHHGYGPFLAAQIIADLKYAEPLRSAPDWFTWCSPGPGSMQGLNALVGRPLKAPWKGDEFRSEVNKLQKFINSRWDYEPFHAQDTQNQLCEFSKYYKAKQGIINPKRKYKHG